MDRILSIAAHTCFVSVLHPFVVIYRGERGGPVTSHHNHTLTAASMRRLVDVVSCKGSLRSRRHGFVWDR